MVGGKHCCVKNCFMDSHNSRGEKINDGIRFFRIPKVKINQGSKVMEVTERRRRAWIAAINLKTITFKHSPDNARVCSRHFHSGTPSYEMLESDPDWAPSLSMGHTTVKETNIQRHLRRVHRAETKQHMAATTCTRTERIYKSLQKSAVPSTFPHTQSIQCDALKSKRQDRVAIRNAKKSSQLCKSKGGENFVCISPGNDSQQWIHGVSFFTLQDDEIQPPELEIGPTTTHTFEPQFQETEYPMVTSQIVHNSEYSEQSITPPPSCEHDYTLPMDAAVEENKNPDVQMFDQYYLNRFCLERFSNSDKLIKFYTGFPNYRTLTNFFLSIESYFYIPEIETWSQQGEPLTDSLNTLDLGLQPIDQLFMFLHKLRLGSYDQELADKFLVTTKTVSRITFTWANTLYFILGSQPLWPSKQRIQKLMPKCFKKAYPKTRVIIDTIKIVVKTPTTGSLSREFYSKSKGSATVKGLIGFTPGGAVSFVSNLYPGSISDTLLVSNSGILDLLEEGDEIMASKDFQISDLIKDKKCTLVIPNKVQSNSMLEHDVNNSKNTAEVQIFLEKTRCLKQFRLFDSALPLYLLDLVNQLWTVACLITNFQHSTTAFNSED